MLGFNTLFCVMFSFSYNLPLMYLSRIGMGITQAFCVIYGPVWVNEFSPPESTTRWMGLLQSAVPLGVMLGYAIAGCFINFAGISWRFAIQIQALAIIPLIVMLHYSDPSQIDVIDHSHKFSIEFIAAGDMRHLDRQHIRIDSVDINRLENFCG
jgi:MFS family permease